MKVTCQICKQKIERDSAYKNESKYYCSQEEYDQYISDKEKRAKDKDIVYKLACEIFGVSTIINTQFFKEWKIWNQVADDEKIGIYLKENKDYMTKAVARITGNEFNRIRYMSAIVKNGLADFKVEEKKVEINIQEPVIDADYVMPINRKKKIERRKGFGE